MNTSRDKKEAGSCSEKDCYSILKRYFELVSFYPEISDPELEKRIEHFTLNASEDELYTVQETFFREGTPYLLEDSRFAKIIKILDGKRIGLAIGKEYQTTVSLLNNEFTIERGIHDMKMPVLSVASRKDYVDALLRRKDPLKMIMARKLKASHKLTLVKWGLGFFDVLLDTSLVQKVLGFQPVVETVLSDTLARMGY